MSEDFSNGDKLKAEAIEAHRRKRGKIEIIGKVAVGGTRDLAMYYTPGVAYACLEINKNKELSYEYTNRANSIAIVTDGTRILGLGNIGPEAGMPVMEGKSLLLKKYGGVDATPIAVGSTDEQEIIKFIKMLAPTYGAINLEDLETPKAIKVLRALEADLPIPIFHDDSYGTAIVTYAGLKNALKLVGKRIGSIKIVINGAGSAGYGISKLLHFAGARNIITCDREGSIYKGRGSHMNVVKEEIAEYTNKDSVKGSLVEVVRGADVLIGVSSRGEFTAEMIKSMSGKPIVFALANPDPEIDYDVARGAGAEIVATGRSGIPNQVNNMLAFPGVFRGLLDTRSSK
ncbi:MAG: NADP-dependent malic enzyme, partial [Candidatus Micrarchaeota archaeon]|nr:NADP-dependent malic enzyme [Candidatus Micrarchaeota archaeon]